MSVWFVTGASRGFDTNVFGVLNVQRAVLPVLHKLAEVADPPPRIQLGADVGHA